jgi:hypothetical protein
MKHVVKISHKPKSIKTVHFQPKVAGTLQVSKEVAEGFRRIDYFKGINLANPFLDGSGYSAGAATVQGPLGKTGPAPICLAPGISDLLRFEIRRLYTMAQAYVDDEKKALALVMLNIARDIRTRNHFWECV